jgi:hypothetical protein
MEGTPGHDHAVDSVLQFIFRVILPHRCQQGQGDPAFDFRAGVAKSAVGLQMEGIAVVVVAALLEWNTGSESIAESKAAVGKAGRPERQVE